MAWLMVHCPIPSALSHSPLAMALVLFGDGHGHAFFDDASIEEVDAALGVARVARIVGDHADRRAGGMELLEQIHDRLAAARVEVAGRLVREQHERLAGDGARHRDALLLTARELTGKVLRAVRHADALERRFDALTALRGLHAP